MFDDFSYEHTIQFSNQPTQSSCNLYFPLSMLFILFLFFPLDTLFFLLFFMRCVWFCFSFFFCLFFLNLFVVFHLSFVNFILSGKRTQIFLFFRIDILLYIIFLFLFFIHYYYSLLLHKMFNCIRARPKQTVLMKFTGKFFFSSFQWLVD